MNQPDFELLPGVFANQGQREAIGKLLAFLRSDDRTFTLIGRAGTGKTTIVKNILESAAKAQMRVGGGAVSHAAKEVLGESIGEKRVHTVASLLAIKLNETTGNFEPDLNARRSGQVPIRGFDLLVIDEASMISRDMMDEMLSEAHPGAKIIFMGDNVQLPPIGDGDDESPTFSVSQPRNLARLTERVRQGEDSPIVSVADLLAANIEGEGVLRALRPRNRITDYDADSDAGVIFSHDEDEVVRMLVSDLAKDPGNPRGTKAIVFNNEWYENSSQSVLNLNRTIREILFADAARIQFNIGEIVVSYAQWSPSPKEPPSVFNAISYVVEAVSDPYEQQVKAKWKGSRLNEAYSVIDLTLRDHKNRRVIVPVIAMSDLERYRSDLNNPKKVSGALFFRLSEAFANIQYGYAITSHKAQGSTYRNVYVFEDNIVGKTNRSSAVTKNKSLYVAVTRPSHKLVMHSRRNAPRGDGRPEPRFVGSLSSKQKDVLRGLQEKGDIQFGSDLV